jgi:hypothetical protein
MKAKKVIDPNSVQVVNFITPTTVNSKSLKSFKSFMSSTPILPLSLESKFNVKIIKNTKPVENDEHDRELNDLLKTTDLINKFTSAELKGKERLNYFKEKVTELAGKKEKKLKMSLPIYIARKKEAEKRILKKEIEAKNMGNFTKKLHKELVNNEKIIREKSRTVKQERGDGITTKNGVMRISPKLIKRIEKKKKLK